MDDARADAYMDLTAQSGWNACADCGKWQPAEALVKTRYGELLCKKCLVFRKCIGQISYEEQALADDDPTSPCAARHRGAISAYQEILRFVRANL